MLNYESSFIEKQFPVSKLSKESYKERKAGSNQTLTGLGKWWGRKPLILVRATILGLLLPTSQDPKKDREIFLKILSMDENGMLLRKNKTVPIKVIFENSTEIEKRDFFQRENGKYIPKYQSGIKASLKSELQNKIYQRMTYDQKLVYCMRPEELSNILDQDWFEINEHLQTSASSLQELIQQLGVKRFGRTPNIGDCFAGGGSIPFEAGRIGSNVYASDLNPFAGLLTWSGLNILSKKNEEIEGMKSFLEDVYDAVNEQVDKWGIERNEKGWRAKYYLYCMEAPCPDCNIKVPLIPNLVVSEGYQVVAKLELNRDKGNYDINIVNDATKEEIKYAKANGTVKNNAMHCPNCGQSTPITALRKDRRNSNGETEYGLRKWEDHEFFPRPEDLYNERIYAIKYIERFSDRTWDELYKKHPAATDSTFGSVFYVQPTEQDLDREQKVIELLTNRFKDWKINGYIPSQKIESGEETTRLTRERGWTHWHQLFNPRQLLINGLLLEKANELAKNNDHKVVSLLAINGLANRNSKLMIWNYGYDKSEQTFANQALNTMFNFPVRAMSSVYSCWKFVLRDKDFLCNSKVELKDARSIDSECDLWITDPPYADAVNYHELSEFFLAWDRGIKDIFPDWYTDSKRVLAVRGTGETFNSSMVAVYSNLAKNMPDNGMQVVMFTHQDVSVWADLTSILWTAGLRVTAAWNIATETESGGLKDGNYVKGTVLLVLRKQNSEETAYLDELFPEVEEEVKNQIDSMRNLDDKEDPNFTDADYLLAAYAASLKVLTAYKNIEDIDVNYELSKKRSNGELSPIEQILFEAIKIAYDYLTPAGFDSFTWKTLIPEERFYIKGLDFEKENIYQLGAYQEIARGFGIREYKPLLASTKANSTRLKSAQEFAMRGISDTDKFSTSLFRNVLAALYQSIKSEDTSKGRNWLRNEVTNYWNQRTTIIELLNFISTLGHHEHMTHWEDEAKYARLLIELVKNDGV